MKIKELYEERAALAEKAGEILTKASEEKRDLTAEEQQEFDNIHKDIEARKVTLDNLERQGQLDQELAKRQDDSPLPGREDISSDDEQRAEENKALEQASFRSWAVGGMGNLTAEQREYMQKRQADLPKEARALSATTGAAGAFTVPEGFHQQIIEALKTFSGMRLARSFILNTESGNDIPVPTSDDTGNKGAIVAENTEVGEQDIAFGRIIFNAYMYTSKIVKVPLQLLQDSAFNMEQFLARKLGERIGRITNEHFTTGDGASKPRGVVTASTLGKTGASGQVSSITYNDLVDLKHSVDPAYRGQAEWMLNDLTLAAITKLIDGQGKPLWAAGLKEGAPDTILNHPYIANDNMPVMAASAKSILFGDFSNYWIRDVMGITLIRLGERYMDSLQVGFLAISRHDGDLVDAGQGPIRHYANAAS